MFRLSDLLNYNSIVVQCHDVPDADTLASAFGIYAFLKEHGKESRIIYSGFSAVSKSNLLLMIRALSIPIEYVTTLDRPDLLVCVDCQYNEGNVTNFAAETIAVIDHHFQTKNKFDLGVIHSQLASCSTLVWDLLRKEGFNFNNNKNVATALYYGLFSDTNNFSEINHPLDRDMRDTIIYDNNIIERLRFCNLTLNELEIAGTALVQNSNNPDRRYALFEAAPCDPNILGFISDLGLQVDTIDVCIVYNRIANGSKISVRSCTREVMASEYIEYLTNGVGSGGGLKEKAGGFIQDSSLEALGMSISEYMNKKTAEYFDSFDVICSSDHNIDLTYMKRSHKKDVPIGYVLSTDVFENNTPIMIRTFEGDFHFMASPNIYLMLGVKGEVYVTKSEQFLLYYTTAEKPLNNIYSYDPTIKNEITGEVKKLVPYMKSCLSNGKSQIYTKQLKRNTKIFNNWNQGYMYGRPGDYLAVKCDDINDVYIIRSDVFEEIYEEC